MLEKSHIIAPENMGLWVAVTFVLALLALAASLVNLYQTSEMMVLTQTEILMLNNKVEGAADTMAAPNVAQQEKK